MVVLWAEKKRPANDWFRFLFRLMFMYAIIPSLFWSATRKIQKLMFHLCTAEKLVKYNLYKQQQKTYAQQNL